MKTLGCLALVLALTLAAGAQEMGGPPLGPPVSATLPGPLSMMSVTVGVLRTSEAFW